MSGELQLRQRMIGAGLWLSAVLICAVSAWIAMTWRQPHRGGLAVMVGGAALVTIVIALLPRERIVAGGFREPFFLSWSLSLIAFIAAAADLDAGVRSPIMLMLFLTLVYAAISYPRWAVGVVSGSSLLAVGVVWSVHDGPGAMPSDPVYLAGLMIALAVTGVMCMVQARIQEQARGELQRVSRSDPLTGALNRLGFAERIGAELSRAARSGGAVGLVVLDFDDFKQVNDRGGHAAGDVLLRWAVGALAGALRPGDGVGRLGGDEFAVVLPDTGFAAAAEIADRITLALSLRVGASTGIAASDHDGPDAETLHRAADQRLYERKRARRLTAVRPDARVPADRAPARRPASG